MASQGQRFRRRALRRGYKVDEVDAFLDRVEATLAGEPVGAPVGAQEVHDVVFRVRFGGYDEWQVDLHLDRVERQVGELEERNGRFSGPDRMGLPDRMGPSGPLGPPGAPGMGGPPDWMGPPDRMGPPIAAPPPGAFGPPERRPAAMGGGGPLPTRPVPNNDPYARPGPPPPYGGFEAPPRGYDGPDGPPRGYDGPDGPPRGYDGPDGPPRGYDGPGGPPMGGGAPAMRSGGFPPDDDYDAPEQPGRRGRMDMTAEIRMPERGDLGRGGPGGPGGGGGPAMGPGPGMGGGPGLAMGGAPGPGGPPLMGPPGSDLARVDQMRRSFQVRRFGSGYDPMQVDRFFEDVLTGMTGRGPIPTTDADFDAAQFGLVPGGYFEAEVEQALMEVRDIVRRR
ncbi:DivIVA domain-containing protein [Asanoa sp. NPDC050611]|uniref:DivIVA domain-containing protein n=1 Tax=Asanoa sp. NPDC050611 TaxID=3157098 RepID=UPI0033DCC908